MQWEACSVLNRAALEDIMYGRRNSTLVGAVLLLLSLCYGVLIGLRGAAYRFGVLKKRALPIRVISIGNITLGGTGKTPAVIAAVSLLQRRGMRPIVLSRGYGRADESVITVAMNPGASAEDRAMLGDEPSLIAQLLPGVPVAVGRDRYAAALQALKRCHPDVAVLDDGFQHLRLHRDLDIVLLDARHPFSTGRLFPAGILREPLSSLRRAHVILLTRTGEGEDTALVRRQVASLTDAPVLTSRHVPVGLREIATGIARPLSALSGAKVLAFSGIARPESFLALLRELGAVITTAASYPDHHDYSQAEITGMVNAAREGGAAMVVTTDKDGVKLRSTAPPGVWTLRISLEVVEKQEWERVLLHGL